MSECILITGATGFIGQNLTKLLLDLDFKVIALVRASSKNKSFVKKIKKKITNFILFILKILNHCLINFQI